MSGFRAALAGEVLKVRRSRVPLYTALGFLLAPLMGGVFMVILKDPEGARSMGLLAAKAQVVAGSADWPTYLGLLAQSTAVGGSFVFAIVAAWVFGREHVDRTAKTWLALPTPRGAVVAAKLALVGVWCMLLAALVAAAGVGIGALVGLPQWSGALALRGLGAILLAGLLTTGLATPIAFVASAGRGYLAPLAFAILTVFLAQIAAALGRGGWFPWAVPSLVSGVAGPGMSPGAPGYALVALTSALGAAGTWAWWRFADQAG